MNRRMMAVGRAVVVGFAVVAMGSSPSSALPRAAFQSSPIPTLAAYWPFDTSANDLSGNGNNGTLVSGAAIDTATFAPFPPGNVASLNTPSTGDYVTVPTSASLQITGSFTLAAWINTTATGPNQQGIIEKWNSSTNQNGYFLRLNASNYLTFNIMPASGAAVGIDTSPRAVATGGWHHVAGVYDAAAGSMLMYVDGVVDATQLLSGAPAPGADASGLRIGDDYGANNFLGHIDEARIYSSALTAAQVGTLMTGQLPPTGLTATPGPGQIALGWTGATAASSYNIYRSTSGGAYTLLANTSGLGYTDLSVTSPTSYSYEVTAVGALESAPAGPVTASPLPTGPGTG
ncbi:MAG TPA: LamG-like jellyroll fold domain-containing protein, partial [Planctomycetota bacterium]|nr:LamG-like jellyroll fold domain-containing protein [Planctomycetota bacterium]